MAAADYPWNNTDIEQSTIDIVNAITSTSGGGQNPLAANVSCQTQTASDYASLQAKINSALSLSAGRLFSVEHVYDTINALYIAYIYTFPA